MKITETSPAAVDAATAAYLAAQAPAGSKRWVSARSAFNKALKAAKAVEPRTAVAEASADQAMQACGGPTLNDIRWSECSGGVGA